MPISKLHSILAVANLLAQNNISQICYCGQISLLQTAAVHYSFPDNLTSSGVTFELDVDPQRDDDASPMPTYRCMLRPTWMISALQHKSKYKSNSIYNFMKKKIQFLGFHGEVIVKTFPLMYQLLM